MNQKELKEYYQTGTGLQVVLCADDNILFDEISESSSRVQAHLIQLQPYEDLYAEHRSVAISSNFCLVGVGNTGYVVKLLSVIAHFTIDWEAEYETEINKHVLREYICTQLYTTQVLLKNPVLEVILVDYIDNMVLHFNYQGSIIQRQIITAGKAIDTLGLDITSFSKFSKYKEFVIEKYKYTNNVFFKRL